MNRWARTGFSAPLTTSIRSLFTALTLSFGTTTRRRWRRCPGQVAVDAADRIARPGVGDVDSPSVRPCSPHRHPDVRHVGQLLQVVAGLLDELGIGGADVGDALGSSGRPMPSRLSSRIDMRPSKPAPRRSPSPSPPPRQGRPVGAVHDPGAEHGVRHRVLGALVIERVLEAGQDRAEVADVRAVHRLGQLARHQLGKVVVGGRQEQIRLHLAAAQLLDGLVVHVEGGHLDGDAVLLLERGDHLFVDVVGVVEDLERAGLGHEDVGDGRVVVEERQRHRVLGRTRQRVGATAAATAATVVVAATRGQQGTDTGRRDSRRGRATQELSTAPTNGHQWTSP